MEEVTSNVDKVIGRLTNIETVLQRIEGNTNPSEDVSHVPRKDVDPTLQKVYVGIRTNVMNVGDIDGVNQEYKAKIYVGARWKEPYLKGKKQEDIKWDETWQPRIVFHNCINVDEKRLKCYLEYEDDDDTPVVRYSYTLRGTFRENLELSAFPFDIQELNFVILSDWRYETVEFVKNMEIKDSIRTDSFDAAQSWSLKDTVFARPVRQEMLKTGSHKEYPKYVITVYVVRKAGFYMWNILLVIGLIMVLTFASLSVDPMEPADRLSVTLTLLLTSVAFKFVVTQNLPVISYITALDSYVLFCMIFQCVMVVQNSVASLFSTTEKARQFDWICAVVLISVVVVFHIIWGCYVGFKIHKRNSFMSCKKKEYDDLCEEINQAWLQRRAAKENKDKYQQQAEEIRQHKRKKHKKKGRVHHDSTSDVNDNCEPDQRQCDLY